MLIKIRGRRRQYRLPLLFIFGSDKHSHIKRKCDFCVGNSHAARNKLIGKGRRVIFYKVIQR